MEDLAIRCDRCGSPVPEGEIDRSLSLAHCPGCDHVFQWAPALLGSAPALPDPPPGVTVAEEGGELALIWRWRSPAYVAIAAFAVVWNVIIWGGVLDGQLAWFILPHLVLGVVVAYTGAAGLVNRTTFRFRDGRLTVTHGPLPWPNAADLPLSEVQQLCCRRVVTRRKNREKISYDLEVVSGPTTVKVLTGIPDLMVAHWLERRIEAHLRIADQPVVGEMPKA